MRAVLSLMVLMAVTPAAQAALWTAACSDGRQVQYQQIEGAEGYLHLSEGGGNFTTYKLKQTYSDGKIICGSVDAKAAPNQIAAICADNPQQAIRIVTGAQLAKGLKPEKAPIYCPAVVNVN